MATTVATSHTAAVPPVQVLPWDFRTTFPSVLADAIDAGTITAEDAEPENLAGLHAGHGAALHQALLDLDTVHDARRRGLNPATGKVPRTKAKRAALPATLDHEIERLERWWRTLLETYEAAFGDAAADAFGKAVRAAHAGIAVIAGGPVPSTPAHPPAVPEPRPRRESVLAAVFGHDEDGPVDPGREEVEEITAAHAEQLTQLVAAFNQAGPTTVGAAADDVRASVAAYADDFGQPAADQLLGYCRRRAALDRAAMPPLRPAPPA